ncbi:TlpA family protein disulfide reductase [Belliella pelovolcani]|uniref:Cytochrome oxidase Cu insertion factor, SCO1/SenC/PrrC family n=1 Tax=Belliella pelovolcani TaxID=529505 RepID=A0A1N7PN74_9BACT|nr:thioredoxin family protein [Belliella pelovolcani]SIT12038.1 Cytochrome oxidase Cu insertion factor, SCO1/SenC/PrrC family [Belliella pelovolcani]
MNPIKLPKSHFNSVSPCSSVVKKILTISLLLFVKVAFAQSPAQEASESSFTSLSSNPTPFYIMVELRGRDLPDSVMKFYFWEYFIDASFKSLPPTVSEVKAEKGTIFSGNIGAEIYQYTSPPISNPALLHTFFGFDYLLKDLYIFPGDTVKLLVDRDNARSYFIGKNSDTYQVQLDLARENQKALKLQNPVMFGATVQSMTKEENSKKLYEKAVANQNNDINKLIRFLGTKEDRQGYLNEIRIDLDGKVIPGYDILKTYKNTISEDQYELFLAEQIGKAFYKPLNTLNRFLIDIEGDKDAFVNQIDTLGNLNFNSNLITYAYAYQNFLLEKASVLYRSGYKSILQSFDQYPLELREILATRFLGKYFKSISNPNEYLSYAMERATLPWTNEVLNQLSQSRAVGADFIGVNLPNHTGDHVSSADWEGKIVLIDFWFTGCKACIDYYENCIKPAEEYFKDNPNVLFVSINSDRNQSIWLKSLESERYTSKHATNLFAGQEQGKELLTFYNINSYPSQLLLDKEQKILRSGSFARNPEALKEIIEEALNK